MFLCKVDTFGQKPIEYFFLNIYMFALLKVSFSSSSHLSLSYDSQLFLRICVQSFRQYYSTAYLIKEIVCDRRLDCLSKRDNYFVFSNIVINYTVRKKKSFYELISFFRLLFILIKLRMATMLDTIPCERCDIQINLQDWAEHVVSN